MKKIWATAFFVSALSIGVFGQATKSAPDWEIAFGESRGRVHENIIRQTVAADGQITYLNERNGTPAVGQISERDVDEITELLDRLNLPQAKKIPDKEFNECIVSPHLPNIYFDLVWNNKTFNFSHCNTSGDENRKYEYTLNLSVKQKAIYKQLREKLESLFDDEIKNQAETPEPTEGLKNTDIPLIMTGKVWEIVIYRQTRVYDNGDFPIIFTDYFWRGKLTRRGDSSVFDAVWQNEETGEEVRDTVTLAVGEKIVLKRDSEEKENLAKIFEGVYNEAGFPGIIRRTKTEKKPTIISGSDDKLQWAAKIEQ